MAHVNTIQNSVLKNPGFHELIVENLNGCGLVIKSFQY
jgi:hypothetical protein